eukprot:Hpha_TRINITY_DN2559_c0_g1::TRINITY_DN2559_c0_g1_i1::g.1312::m.1312
MCLLPGNTTTRLPAPQAHNDETPTRDGGGGGVREMGAGTRGSDTGLVPTRPLERIHIRSVKRESLFFGQRRQIVSTYFRLHHVVERLGIVVPKHSLHLRPDVVRPSPASVLGGGGGIAEIRMGPRILPFCRVSIVIMGPPEYEIRLRISRRHYRPVELCVEVCPELALHRLPQVRALRPRDWGGARALNLGGHRGRGHRARVFREQALGKEAGVSLSLHPACGRMGLHNGASRRSRVGVARDRRASRPHPHGGGYRGSSRRGCGGLCDGGVSPRTPPPGGEMSRRRQGGGGKKLGSPHTCPWRMPPWRIHSRGGDARRQTTRRIPPLGEGGAVALRNGTRRIRLDRGVGGEGGLGLGVGVVRRGEGRGRAASGHLSHRFRHRNILELLQYARSKVGSQPF